MLSMMIGGMLRFCFVDVVLVFVVGVAVVGCGACCCVGVCGGDICGGGVGVLWLTQCCIGSITVVFAAPIFGCGEKNDLVWLMR